MQFNPMMVAIAGIAAAVLMTVFGPIAKAYARRLGQQPQSAPQFSGGDIDARLARIEQAIESIAVEIERVSEGQRFTTKLLSEQRNTPLPGSQNSPR